MLISKKERIIPKLDDNFHETIFFLEIKFRKNPTKEIKEKLINYYIKGVDYYTSTNQKDFSLYFQTKLLNIMKEQDHFEKTIQSKLIEEDQTEKINEILSKAKNNDDNRKNAINNDFQKQKEQFLFNLSFKKKYNRLKRYNSLKITSNTKQKLAFKSRKNSEKFGKKNSIDLPVFNNKLNNAINKNNNTNTNIIFSKIDNTLIDFDKINTLLIIEYTKKLKHYAKLKLELMDKKTDKYLDYIQINNELNLLYEDLPEKNGEEATNIKNQMKSNEEDWELFNKNEQREYIEKENNFKDKINEKNISNKILNNVFRKISELIKENEKQD